MARLQSFLDRLGTLRILDPACGSGNFLYVSMDLLKTLERQVTAFGATWGVPVQPCVHPKQLYGIEINEYAHELASIVVWIGYLQWKRRNGLDLDDEVPILQPLDNIHLMDAILQRTAAGTPFEPEWPVANFIVGNPPFLGGNRLRKELGDHYIDGLFEVYRGRVKPFADLCCYWHEKAREMIASKKARRAGLLATQGIRGGANRETLQRIKRSGGIFFAESDRPWILDGAAVEVSMVAFDLGEETRIVLDGVPVEGINADLTSQTDLPTARRLRENSGICFMGASPKGPFDLTPAVASAMLSKPVNVNSRHNSDVVRRVVSGVDLVQRSRGVWTVDFGLMTLADAAMYEAPFEYIARVVKPVRHQNRRKAYAEKWWQYAEPRPGMRRALAGVSRFIATPEVSKHRVFVWVVPDVLCNQQTLVFARADDYFFGVLQSRVHEVWALRMGTQLESRPRYTPTTCFETFPLPWLPGKEPEGSAEYVAISEAARELNELRENWLNPPGLSEADLKKRTLTNLYNERPTWLDLAHKKLDAAVFAAYGWPADPSDQELLARLLELNLSRGPA